MTQNKDLKAAIRARMAAEDESFNTARRRVLGERGPGGQTALLAAVKQAMKPGTVTAVVSGGGVTNFGMVSRAISSLLLDGASLVHTTAGRDGIESLPGDVDFAIATGRVSGEEAVTALAGSEGARGKFFERIEPLMRRIFVLNGQTAYENLRRELVTTGATGVAPVLWVQDFDDGGPFATGSGWRERLRPDELAVQLPLLKRLAVETGAVVAMGELQSWSEREGWSAILDHADVTIAANGRADDAGDDRSWVMLRGSREVRRFSCLAPDIANWRWQLHQTAQAV